MNMSLIYTFLPIGFVVGAAALFLLSYLVRKSILAEADIEAKEILTEAQAQFDEDEKEREQIIQEIQMEAWARVEEQHLEMEEKCKELEEEIQTRKKKYEEKDKGLRSSLLQEENDVRQISIRLAELEKNHKAILENLKQLKAEYQKELVVKTNLLEADVILGLKDQMINEATSNAEKNAEQIIAEAKDFSEAKAKRILALCIDRFSKEMSTERHIATTFFPNERVREMFCKQLKENSAAVSELTGCDIYIEDPPQPDRLLNVQVIGYDPVRRELTRRIFEKIFSDCEKKNKVPTPETIKQIADYIRPELLRQIKKDGDQLAKELGLSDLNPEIKQVMGSLRYRYSYTQNQYFHCGEVGWFAGLLMAELNNRKIPENKLARRSGFLHDLGKALDHEIDGSHAVIGADFIQARGEVAEIVHAVRAHHHDVAPENNLDFIVIAADAISGGRPGARRSTMETYTQKVTGLQEISKRFNGVTDVFILNGGRECRVLVNSRTVDDLGALKISEQIARTIEDEMQYPGQIKVVVVRETVVSEARQSKDHHRDYRR
jgi:ribonucrease Y